LPDEGIWTVELLRNSEKIDEKKFRINSASSTHHISNNAKIIIYPNPVIDKLTINFEGLYLVQQNELRYQLFNIFGQNLMKGTLNQCYPNCEITTESLPAGLYLLEIRDHEKRLLTQIISINSN